MLLENFIRGELVNRLVGILVFSVLKIQIRAGKREVQSIPAPLGPGGKAILRIEMPL